MSANFVFPISLNFFQAIKQTKEKLTTKCLQTSQQRMTEKKKLLLFMHLILNSLPQKEVIALIVLLPGEKDVTQEKH